MGARPRHLLAALLLAAPAARAQAVVRTVALLPVTSGVLAVQARSDDVVLVAASTAHDTATIALQARDVRLFADSTARLVTRGVPRSRRARVFRSIVTDRTTGAGLSFARHVADGASVYRFYFARANITGFPFEVSRGELDLFLGALRRGAREARWMAARPDSVPPR
jgi:hypothetical protein